MVPAVRWEFTEDKIAALESLGQELAPLNIYILDYDKHIRDRQLKQVTATFIHAPSSDMFHPEGLFSEEIFGEVVSPNRMITEGWIGLRCKVFHPQIYHNILTLKAAYADIISGKSYAVFDHTIHDFVPADENAEGANTGYTFFLNHFKDIVFNESESLTRRDRITIVERYGDLLYVDKWLVTPAGLRDLKTDRGRSKSDDINGLYSSLINYTRALPDRGNPPAIFDNIRYSIQRKLVDIEAYIENILEGKTGFFQGKYGKRSIALGTRNVISPSKMSAPTLDSPQFLKATETKVPLFQAAKGFTPLVIYQMKNLFFNQVVSSSTDQISVIDPTTYRLEYKIITEEEKDKFLSSDGLRNLINLYRDVEFRTRPVTIFDMDGNRYYLFLVYDDGDVIYHFRSLSEFREWYREEKKQELDETKLRPLSYMELLYITTYVASMDKHVQITRYPVLIVGSSYVSKVHLVSTEPSRVVKVQQPSANMEFMLPHYPILGRGSIDSTQLHPSRLNAAVGLGGDFDGDTVSVNPILSKEANEECKKYLEGIGNLVRPDGTLSYGGATDLISLTFYNLSIIN